MMLVGHIVTALCMQPTAHRGAQSRMLFDGLFGKKAPEASAEDQAAELGVQLPAFTVLASGTDWEVRRYQQLAVVECAYERRPEGYELLGGYAQQGENESGLPMPKTAPCLMAPFKTPKLMWFILPHPHTPLDPAESRPVPPPKPLADDVLRCREITDLVVGVGAFSGYAVPDVVISRRDQLSRALASAGYSPTADAEEEMLLAQYNELFALPWNRDNEVWLPVALGPPRADD